MAKPPKHGMGGNMATDKKRLSRAVMAGVVLPCFLYPKLGWFMFVFMLPIGVYAWVECVSEQSPLERDKAELPNTLFTLAFTPWADFMYQLGWFATITGFFAFVWLGMMAKWTRNLRYAVYCAALVLPLAFYLSDTADLHRTPAKAAHTVSGVIPGRVSVVERMDDYQEKREYFLVVGGKYFKCLMPPAKTSFADDWLCGKIYRHAGKTAEISYLTDSRNENRVLSLKAGGRVLLAQQQMQAVYLEEWRRFWQEFFCGALLVGLPFFLLHIWARKITAAEKPQCPPA